MHNVASLQNHLSRLICVDRRDNKIFSNEKESMLRKKFLAQDHMTLKTGNGLARSMTNKNSEEIVLLRSTLILKIAFTMDFSEHICKCENM